MKAPTPTVAYSGETLPLVKTILSVLSYALYVLVLWNFFRGGVLASSLIAPAGLLYTACLIIYAVKRRRTGKVYDLPPNDRGEIHIIIWTALIVGLILLGNALNRLDPLPIEIIAVYIIVMAIFGVTRKFKARGTGNERGPAPAQSAQPVRQRRRV